MTSPDQTAKTPAIKDGRFWLAVAIIGGFVVLTGLVLGKAKDFTEAFRLWDGVAVLFSTLVGGLLGLTVNYTRATQAEDKARKKENEADVAKVDAARSKQAEAALRPIADRIIELRDRRRAEPDSVVVLEGGGTLAAPPSQASFVVERGDFAGKTLRVANVDPDLLLLADQAQNVLNQVDALA